MPDLRRRPVKSLHLYRALLREVTYLPDLTARTYFHRHIVSRFRQTRDESHSIDNGAPLAQEYATRTHSPQQRIKTAVENAARGLRDLQNANHGSLISLEKVLSYAYGRAGKRRHELLAAFLQDVHERAVEETSMIPAAQHLKVDKSYTRYVDWNKERKVFEFSLRFPRLRALFESTTNRGSRTRSRSPIKVIDYEPPLTNIWGRPLVLSRQRNLLKKFYATMLDRLLPPLPRPEFERLKGLARGEIRWEGLRLRRPGIQPHARNAHPSEIAQLLQVKGTLPDPDGNSSQDSKPFNITRQRSAPTWHLEISEGRSQASQVALEHALLIRSKHTDWRIRPHNIDGPLMKRLYKRILNECCYEIYREKEDAWDFIWGDKPRRSLTTADNMLFQGVDKRGKFRGTSELPQLYSYQEIKTMNAAVD